ncbi:MAG TPA: DUF488 family protein [Holophagaceae bacterium]|nr:DUF488 family protein [Holophagaceae bacterium]
MIRIKRAYELPSRGDGTRILADRLWPRGCTKEALALDGWAKEATPSPELRKAYHAGALAFPAFEAAYRRELQGPAGRTGLEALLAIARAGDLTLVTATKDERQNHALVLKAVLESHLKERP